MVLIDDDIAELFNNEVIEYDVNEFIGRSNVDRDEMQYEKYIFNNLPKNHRKLYNDKLICELFGQNN